MKQPDDNNAHLLGVIKDSMIIGLLFAFLSIVETGVAAFVSIIATGVLLVRRIVLNLNPGFIKGYNIRNNGEELIIPEGIDVFQLYKVPTVEYLKEYVEVICSILIPPEVLIIRFNGIREMHEQDLMILSKIIMRLHSCNIIVIISEAEKSVQDEFKTIGIDRIIGDLNTCLDFSEALLRAVNLIEMKWRQNCEKPETNIG